MKLAVVLAFGAVAAAQAAPPAGLSLDDRIRCQEAVEEVYWTHRSPGGGLSFAQAVPDTVVQRRAEDTVLKTAALQRLWSVTITPPQLQAELDRMAAHSQAPARLRELFAALGNDPVMAAECLARPLLVDRLLRSHYAHDQRLHGDLRARAEREARDIDSANASERTTGVRTELEWWRGRDPQRGAGALALEPDEFDARVRELGMAMGRTNGEIALDRASPLREDETRFNVLVVHELDDEHVRLSAIAWPKRPFEQWWDETRGQLTPEPDGPAFEFRLPAVAGSACPDDTWKPTRQLLDPRYWHTAVWTGSEMIVFGGMSSVNTIYGDGSRYDPATENWTLLPATGSPGERQAHVAVWTGTEMVVWGGRSDPSGARYDPLTDTWQAMSTVNAPVPRWNASVVWTGTEMLVWGGEAVTGVVNSGARYDPASDTWTPMATAPLAPRAYHSAVWTGSQMIIWAGYNVHIGQLYGDGARYSPATNSWTAVTGTNAPNARTYHTAVWTGTEMIVWGGANPPYDLSGGRYDPATDTWTPTSLVDAPSLRWFHAAVWTGTEMIIEGGSFNVVAGARYDPASDTWTPTSPVNSANNGQGITAVWTGAEMIVWGGLDDDFLFHYDGGRYDPLLDVWHPTGTMNVPMARGLHAAVWTGSEMIIYGGSGWGALPPPGSYDPATDSWRVVNPVGAPVAGGDDKAVWTGTEAIFWGGEVGARYNPTTDSWTLTSTTNAPVSGPGHSVVWTGSELIVFGGIGTDNVAKRYRPATDTWVDATIVDAPGARDHHAAVWSGTEMIIWGGFINDGTTPTGGRYDPVADAWTPTNVADSPITRMWPVAVWTGTEMIVWGGYDWLFLGDLGDGARYDPATDSWTPTTLVNAPSPRIAQGVWTGKELLLWGGTNDSSGGRYDPATDSWIATTLVDAPPVRFGGRWSTVWTGSEMIIWGGIIETQQGSRYCAATASEIFADGFESGDTSAWTVTVP